MDEDLDSLAQRYAIRRNIKLGERLGFGVHGAVFAAEDNTKPGFLAVKNRSRHGCHYPPSSELRRGKQRARSCIVSRLRCYAHNAVIAGKIEKPQSTPAGLKLARVPRVLPASLAVLR